MDRRAKISAKRKLNVESRDLSFERDWRKSCIQKPAEGLTGNFSGVSGWFLTEFALGVLIETRLRAAGQGRNRFVLGYYYCV